MDSVFKFFENLFNYSQDQGGWWVIALVDIIALATIIYFLVSILKKTHATQLVTGVFFLGALYIGAVILNLSTVLWIIKQLGFVIVIVVVIVFQPEIRKVFSRIARTGFFRKGSEDDALEINVIIEAAEMCREQKRGALIVFERNVSIKNIADTGTKIDGEISTSLICSIFLFDTPLHDGAIIIQNGRIVAAGCYLPLSEQADIKKTFGTRHRAALGASENSDAVILVVSEETGAFSLAYEANLSYDLSVSELRKGLRELLENKIVDDMDMDNEGEEFDV